jgi:hypothetical protein
VLSGTGTRRCRLEGPDIIRPAVLLLLLALPGCNHPPAPTVTLALAGDVMLGRDVARLCRTKGDDCPFVNVGPLGNLIFDEKSYGGNEGLILTCRASRAGVESYTLTPTVVRNCQAILARP